MSLALIVEPHVVASILDHYQRRMLSQPRPDDPSVEVRVNRCRGWLIGNVSHTAVNITNFLPDTFNRPEGVSKKAADLRKAYMKTITDWQRAITYHHPTDQSVIGFYSVGDGSPLVTHAEDEKGQDILHQRSFDQWMDDFRRNLNFKSRGEGYYLEVRAPSKTSKTLEFVGHRYVYEVKEDTHQSIVTDNLMEVRIVPETHAANTIMNTVIRAAYDEKVEQTVVPALDLDKILCELPTTAAAVGGTGDGVAAAPGGAFTAAAAAKIKEVMTKLQQAAKESRSKAVKDALETLQREREAVKADAAVSGGGNDVRTQNALMIKYVTSLIQEQVQLLEQSIRLNQTQNRMKPRWTPHS